ncbi:MAG: NADH-quinone oxidoreductase subunit L [Verrucomicrobiaceae bacterium]|nr:NADH-quinone oxidoreductase subunit L [Verrucomicrobiaceae bacterium]
MNSITPASIVLLLPLFSAFTILLLHKQLKGAAALISIGSSAVCAIVAMIMLGAKDTPFGEPQHILSFIHLTDTINFDINAIIDGQSRGMLFIVTFIGFLVHLYSHGYMKDDEARPRYFGSLSMFMFSMTGIVLADNLVMMFIFWELVGLSSYLLIGHWFEKPSACDAAKKAFLTNRVGDFGFMIGILLLFGLNHGSVEFADLADSFKNGPLHDVKEHHQWVITAAALCIFMGAVGKSAQVPLHVWLPDAMEGPTPVSALIHAATMVAAGVYMLVRVSFLIGASEFAGEVIAGVGGITAIFAALMAVQQNDIKRILAYSTLSQLGYMVMAVGLGAGEAGMFHLYTHAFFKALLFLGSGAVIYACHHEQDIWKMGGLNKQTPATYITFAIGTAALIGVPFVTSGFWSKEGILGAAYEHCKILFAIGAFTAFLTAFYMTRLMIVAFLGKPRTDSASHASDPPLVMVGPLLVLSILSLTSALPIVRERLQAMVPHEHHSDAHWLIVGVSITALVAGVALAFKLYKGKDKDPLNIPLFANKFYVDEFYAGLVKYAQDRLAWIVTGLERIFVDGLIARLPAAIACRIGSAARSLQAGHLQGYTFLLGAGIVLAIYVAVFVLPRIGG